MPTLNEILKNSDYNHAIFKQDDIQWLEKRITAVEGKKGIEYKANCIIRNKEIKITPEEAIRQLYTYKLIEEYGYAPKQIQFEYPIKFGREAKRADIVIVNKLDFNTAYIIAEIKKPKAKDGRDQLKSYCHATGATMAIWTNGENIDFYHRKNPNYFEPINGLPNANQSLAEFLNKPFTLQHLIDDQINKANQKWRGVFPENTKINLTPTHLSICVSSLQKCKFFNSNLDVVDEAFEHLTSKPPSPRKCKRVLPYKKRARHC